MWRIVLIGRQSDDGRTARYNIRQTRDIVLQDQARDYRKLSYLVGSALDAVCDFVFDDGCTLRFSRDDFARSVCYYFATKIDWENASSWNRRKRSRWLSTLNEVQASLTFLFPRSPNNSASSPFWMRPLRGWRPRRANAEKNLKNARELFDGYLNLVFARTGDDWDETTLGSEIKFFRDLPSKAIAIQMRQIGHQIIRE